MRFLLKVSQRKDSLSECLASTDGAAPGEIIDDDDVHPMYPVRRIPGFKGQQVTNESKVSRRKNNEDDLMKKLAALARKVDAQQEMIEKLEKRQLGMRTGRL